MEGGCGKVKPVILNRERLHCITSPTPPSPVAATGEGEFFFAFFFKPNSDNQEDPLIPVIMVQITNITRRDPSLAGMTVVKKK